MLGQGKMGVFSIAMRELEKAGICTAEVRQVRSKELAEDIREVG